MTYDKLLQDMINSARKELKEGLSQCTEAQQMMFKRMYSHKNLELPINEVVDNMEVRRIERAMDQVEKTVKANKEGMNG
ncbi:hypothetical protein LCGC14_0395610 [marine sediment metagenome]|uniref:Uncharacterized protein n=1 Tax=marine sediment metagenome TaxID=412755 RepID=A0A0F9SYF6_9ZZZZ